MLKIDRVGFLRKIHFCPNLGEKGLKIGYFALFLKILLFVFPIKNVKCIYSQTSIRQSLCGPFKSDCLGQVVIL